MKKLLLNLLVTFFLAMGSASVVKAQTENPSDAKTVKAIEVKGNKTISMATILSRIKTRVGQPYMQSVISDDLKRLYNTGYFSNVSVDREDMDGGFKVIVFLEEKPIVEEVTFSKTKYIKSKTLSQKLETKAGKFLDKKDINDDIETMKGLFAQKGLTTVEIEAETFVDEVTNKASVHFVIREGHKIRIKQIAINGNKAFKDNQILKVIKTKKKWLFGSGYLKEDLLDEDMERIVSYYEQTGYIDAMVDYTIEYLYKGNIKIQIDIDEGKRYSVGSILITGNSIISTKEILKAMEEVKDGGVFSREKLSVDIASIRTFCFDRGYIFADVKESTSLDSLTGKVGVNIDVAEGGLAYIEKIKIQGNTRTRDIVIRRELRMNPGDRFDGAKLRRSKERLSNLGYFDEIGFDIEDTDSQDRKNLVVQVKEAKTGSFSFGGGFSTVDKIVGFVEIEQRNFDITNWPTFTGGGQRLSLRAETGSTKNNLLLSFTEPWIFDYPVSGGFDVFKKSRDREVDTGYAYDEERLGGVIRFGKQFSDYNSGNVSYRFEEIEISNFEDNVSADLLAEGGTNAVSVLGFNVNRNTTDSIFNPTKGYAIGSSVDFAGGVLGGDKDFYRLQANGSYYVPLAFKSVLEFRLMGGIVDAYGDSDKVPIFERFFAGGARSIRGYNERKVGPLDSNTNDPIGGESIIVGNVEFTIPLIEYIKLAAFFDTGNVWADVNDIGSGSFKSGMGIGARIKTPIGPISLDYGYPLSDEPGEDEKSGKFYFSISRGF